MEFKENGKCMGERFVKQSSALIEVFYYNPKPNPNHTAIRSGCQPRPLTWITGGLGTY